MSVSADTRELDHHSKSYRSRNPTVEQMLDPAECFRVKQDNDHFKVGVNNIELMNSRVAQATRNNGQARSLLSVGRELHIACANDLNMKRGGMNPVGRGALNYVASEQFEHLPLFDAAAFVESDSQDAAEGAMPLPLLDVPTLDATAAAVVSNAVVPMQFERFEDEDELAHMFDSVCVRSFANFWPTVS